MHLKLEVQVQPRARGEGNMVMRMQLLIAAGAVLTSSPASADTVCEWMGFAETVQRAAAVPLGPNPTPNHDRALTHVALAMFESLNAIDRRYESYVGVPVANPRASQEAAAIASAHTVLLAHYPSQKSLIDQTYRASLARVGSGSARQAGEEIGTRVAAAAMKAAGVSQSTAGDSLLPKPAPGAWVPSQMPQFAFLGGSFRPWILPSANAARPSPPPSLESERWAQDYEEVKQLGGRNSKKRTADQSLIARYWVVPDMMPSFRSAADAPGRSPVDNARMFAMLAMIGDDALLAVADAKIQYAFWRPITAIRNADADGNDATEPDSSWEPFIATPNHPEYPCGHCIFAAATAEFMKSQVGNAPVGGVRMGSGAFPDAPAQSLPTWDEWVRQISLSRVVGGVHFRFSTETGEKMGRTIAQLAMDRLMRPLATTESGRVQTAARQAQLPASPDNQLQPESQR